MPSRDEAYEITGSMLVQLLRRSGHHAKVLPIGAVTIATSSCRSWRFKFKLRETV